MAPTPNVQAGPADDEYRLGLTLYNQQRWELAAETLQSYLQAYPEHTNVAVAQLYLAQSYVNLKKYDVARQQLREFLKKYPANKNLNQALYRVAECSYFLNDFDAAIKEFEAFRASAQDSELNQWALPYLADSYLRNDQAKQAAETFAASLKQYPEGRFAEDSLFGLARSLELTGQPDQAITEYEKLIALPASGRADEAYINLGMLHFRQRDFERAADTFLKLATEDPENALALLARLNAGYAYYSMKQWERAATQFTSIPATSNYYEMAQYWLAQARKSQQQYDVAVDVLSQLQSGELSATMQPRITYQLAECQFQLKKYAAAQDGYLRYVKTWPSGEQAESAVLHAIEAALLSGQIRQGWDLSQTWSSQINSPASQRELSLLKARLLRAADNPLDALPESLGTRQQRLELASTILAPMIARLDSTEPDELSEQLRVQAAQIQIERQQYEQAITLLEPITTQRPETTRSLIPEAWLLLANAQLQLKQYAAALSACEQLSETDSPDSAIRQQAALISLSCLIELDQFAEAQTQLELLNELEIPGEKLSQATYRLAEAEYENENWQQAAELYQQVLSRTDDPQWTQKAMSGLGWAQFEAGQFEQSSETFAELKEKFPKKQVVAADASYMRGMAELKADEPAKAAQSFLETARMFASDSDEPVGNEVNFVAYRAAREAARLFRQQGEIDQAAAAYDLAYQELVKQPAPQSDNLDKLLDEWALLHFKAKQFAAADAVFRLLVEQRPNSNLADDARLSLAESDYINKKLDDAQAKFMELIDLPTADQYVKRRARYQLILIAADQENNPLLFEQAQAYLEQTDSTSADFAERGEVTSLLIQYYLENGQLEQAQTALTKLFEQVATVDKKQDLAWLPDLYVQAGELALRQKNYGRASELLEKIETEFPQSAQRDQLAVIVGRALIKQAEFAAAKPKFEEVIDRSGGKKTLAAAQSQFYLAETALIQKDYASALKDYIRLVVLFPDFPDLQVAALYQAGQCDEALGNSLQAVQNYETLLKQFPNSEYAAKARQRIAALTPPQ